MSSSDDDSWKTARCCPQNHIIKLKKPRSRFLDQLNAFPQSEIQIVNVYHVATETTDSTTPAQFLSSPIPWGQDENHGRKACCPCHSAGHQVLNDASPTSGPPQEQRRKDQGQMLQYDVDMMAESSDDGDSTITDYLSEPEWDFAPPASYVRQRSQYLNGQKKIVAGGDHGHPRMDGPGTSAELATREVSTYCDGVKGDKTDLPPTTYYNPTTFAAISHLANICYLFPAFHVHVRTLQSILRNFHRQSILAREGKDGFTKEAVRRLDEAICREWGLGPYAVPPIVIDIADDDDDETKTEDLTPD